MNKHVIMLLQITVLCNAILMGWKVKVSGNKIILRKKIADMTPIDYDINRITECLIIS